MRVFAIGVATTNDRVIRFHLQGLLAAMGKFPWAFHGRGVILDMLYIAATLQYQRLAAPVTQFLGRPAAADTRTHHNCIERMRLIRVAHNFRNYPLKIGRILPLWMLTKK